MYTARLLLHASFSGLALRGSRFMNNLTKITTQGDSDHLEFNLAVVDGCLHTKGVNYLLSNQFYIEFSVMSGRNECRIYVGNLPPDIRTKDIQDLFYKFGKVTFVDLKNRRGPPFAFVEFEDARYFNCLHKKLLAK